MTRPPQQLIEDLKELDVDYVVDVLDISAEELVEAFPHKVRAYLIAELGEDFEDEEDDY